MCWHNVWQRALLLIFDENKSLTQQIITYANRSTENFGAASTTEKADCVAQLKVS